MDSWKLINNCKLFKISNFTQIVYFSSQQIIFAHLLNNLNQIFKQLLVVSLTASSIGDDGGRQVSENVRTHGLDSVQISEIKTLVWITVNFHD